MDNDETHSLNHSCLTVNGFQDGYTMEQAQRREPMPEYPNPGISRFCNSLLHYDYSQNNTLLNFNQKFDLLIGEITFKLHSKWDENLLNENSATFKILEGNVRKAVRHANT